MAAPRTVRSDNDEARRPDRPTAAAGPGHPVSTAAQVLVELGGRVRRCGGPGPDEVDPAGLDGATDVVTGEPAARFGGEGQVGPRPERQRWPEVGSAVSGDGNRPAGLSPGPRLRRTGAGSAGPRRHGERSRYRQARRPRPPLDALRNPAGNDACGIPAVVRFPYSALHTVVLGTTEPSDWWITATHTVTTWTKKTRFT